MSSNESAASQNPVTDRPTWSIASRLTLWYATSAFVLVALATGVLYWVLVTNVDREDDQFLVDTVQILRGLMHERPADVAALRQEVEWEGATRRYARLFVRILDDQGQVVVETPGTDAIFNGHEPPAPAALDVEPESGVDVRSGPSTPYRVLAAHARVGAEGRTTRLIQVALDRTGEQNVLRSYRARLWTVLGLALLAAGAVGHTMARRGMHPIKAITDRADGIGSSTLDARIPTAGLPAELSRLAITFNQMLNRLEEAFARLSSFSADLAHELRTPINNLRGEVEVALGRPRDAGEYRRVLESTLEECMRVCEMIDGLLLVARADSPETQIIRVPVDVHHELSSMRDLYEPAAAETGVQLEIVQMVAPLTASLDRTLFQRAITNLVTNALAHTPTGGQVRLSAALTANDTLRVAVIDTGRGIPPEHLSRVSDRFFRVDRSRSAESGGLGLGLAIVTSIARVHGGCVEIASVVGRGTTVTLSFPGAVLNARAAT
jgi:two-component system heavy metal sensor histidine kinase CusS